ncbi:hypothetical protein HU230_0006375 [Bradyrhizobium quebecense]|uniref:Uncharacterized protein n=1 Tax=Bradyrhizobium quebecense TaxID=2748629 RepID=A0A973WQ84_9BRAD|nr:hypothetical protein [Bradyrhizobium quebecense]UGA45661.1 hypothetical protein HU230_0006375 [Bradyrhizobium quebecense]
MRAVAVLIDGEVYSANGTRIGGGDRISETRAVTTMSASPVVNPASMGGVEEIVSMLARIVKMAQGLSADDKRRVREFVEAARSTLFATTRLDATDQRVFEMALCSVARDWE